MTQQESDKLLELYQKGYEIFRYEDEFCELYDDGTWHCTFDTEEEFIVECDIDEFTVKKIITNWRDL